MNGPTIITAPNPRHVDRIILNATGLSSGDPAALDLSWLWKTAGARSVFLTRLAHLTNSLAIIPQWSDRASATRAAELVALVMKFSPALADAWVGQGMTVGEIAQGVMIKVLEKLDKNNAKYEEVLGGVISKICGPDDAVRPDARVFHAAFDGDAPKLAILQVFYSKFTVDELHEPVREALWSWIADRLDGANVAGEGNRIRLDELPILDFLLEKDPSLFTDGVAGPLIAVLVESLGNAKHIQWSEKLLRQVVIPFVKEWAFRPCARRPADLSGVRVDRVQGITHSWRFDITNACAKAQEWAIFKKSWAKRMNGVLKMLESISMQLNEGRIAQLEISL